MKKSDLKIIPHPDDPNVYIDIYDDKEQITDNFQSWEFFNRKVNLPHHLLSRQAIDAVQLIRTWFGVKIRITSTYRTYIPSGGATYSPHMLAQAIDWQFIIDDNFTKAQAENLYLIIREDFKNKGPLFQELWKIGVRGFGSYDTFVHIDTVVPELYPKFKAKRGTTYLGRHYARWDKMKELKYLYPKPELMDVVAAIPDQEIIVNPTATTQPSMTESATDYTKRVAGSIVGYLGSWQNREDFGQDYTTSNVAKAIIPLLLMLLTIVAIMTVFYKNME